VGARPGKHVVIRLVPAARIEGRIFDADDGSPIADALVTMACARSGYDVDATTAAGRFALDGCHAGDASLSIRTPEHGVATIVPIVHAGETTTTEIPMRRGPMVRARVIDTETGAPVVLERVRSESNAAADVRILGDGRFEM
jgi:hypothetical protein